MMYEVVQKVSGPTMLNVVVLTMYPMALGSLLLHSRATNFVNTPCKVVSVSSIKIACDIPVEFENCYLIFFIYFFPSLKRIF